MVIVTEVTTGNQLLNVPLIEHILIAKAQIAPNMTDQEYLDREDHFSITIVLGT